MNKDKTIILTVDQFLDASARVIEEVMNESGSSEISMFATIVSAKLATQLFGISGKAKKERAL